MLMVPSQQPTSEERRKRLSVPGELSTAKSKLVYLTLAVEGEQTVRELSTRLRLGSSEIFPVLRMLRDAEVVARDGEYYSLEEA